MKHSSCDDIVISMSSSSTSFGLGSTVHFALCTVLEFDLIVVTC